MSDFLNFVARVLESTIYIYIAYQLLGRKIKIKNAIIIGCILGGFWSFSYLVGPGILRNMLVYRMLMVLMVYIASRANILKVLISVFVSLNVSRMMEYTVMALISTVLNIRVTYTFENFFIRDIVYLISFIFGYVFYLLLKKYDISLFDSNQNSFSVERTFSQDSNILTRTKEIFNDYNVIIMIIVLQMTLITYYFYSIEFFTNKSVFNFELKTVFLSIAILILNIFTLFMAKKIQKVREENYHNKIKEMEFSQIENENLIIKQYKHDLYNHFNLLCGLAEEKKHDEVYSYLVNYHEDIKSKIIPIKTGMNELDVLLYSKINKAQQNNIRIEYKCFANIKCNKSHIIDFISIIGNLLDNAIEASQKSEKKFIGVYINEEILEYIFTIKNTYEEKTILTSDILLQDGFSTKGSGRGLGLKIVNRLVKKYEGNIVFTNDEDFFKIKVVLPKHELLRY